MFDCFPFKSAIQIKHKTLALCVYVAGHVIHGVGHRH